ncbi:MAG: OmpA family protein [Methylomarinum sp.]|nr:OmpA family protein [Methylomarinum sp.]
MSTFKKVSFSWVLALFVWQAANAQAVKMYSDKAPSAEEMGSILFSNQPAEMKPAGIKMRSISFGKPKNLSEPKAVSQQSSTIGLPIKFGYNSSEILNESKPFLNEIGRMLSLPDFSGEKLLIEGHTDASGSENYNRYLSERRAESVKNYLRNNFNIASNRLFVTGMGESQSLPGVDPFAAVNRRVQFRKSP